jgi:hypothetical protein
MPTDYPAQLLELARELVAGRPNRAKLHRAGSTAYYALFHLLIQEGTRLVRVDPDLRRLAGRAFDHGTMRKVANQVRSGNLPNRVAEVFPVAVPPELKRVAEVFVAIQGRRHEADYDIGRPTFTKSEVQGFISEVEDAFVKWRAVAGQPVAKAFLIALLLHKDWGG